MLPPETEGLKKDHGQRDEDDQAQIKKREPERDPNPGNALYCSVSFCSLIEKGGAQSSPFHFVNKASKSVCAVNLIKNPFVREMFLLRRLPPPKSAIVTSSTFGIGPHILRDRFQTWSVVILRDNFLRSRVKEVQVRFSQLSQSRV